MITVVVVAVVVMMAVVLQTYAMGNHHYDPSYGGPQL